MLTAVAGLLMLVLFFVPLWRIQLHAPQYPEGLGMLIRVNTITGLEPTDLNNINGLNHYIGMKAIEPDGIPVLRYMPWVVGMLALFGVVTALVGRRALLMGWIGAFGLAGAAGLVEFYLWSYDYGHNLAADAVIKVPGMTYQPPLIGSKQLLNINASSWPDVGGWLALVAFVMAVVALAPFRQRAHGVVASVLKTAHAAAVVLAAAALLSASACRSADPKEIAYGRADCHVCRMRITDARYGGEVVSHTGKVQQFDSIECLANYSVTPTVQRDARSTWVSDFDHPGHLVEASSARFIRRGGPGSPMGAGLLAVAPTTDVAALTRRFATTPLTWVEVRALAERGALGAS
ncbi:MAG: nitrous oxide reductase accessory protein NosL [Gemmatimonadaceae bacterium]